MKKLAVLLPAYNAASYLKVSIDSVLEQTFSDFDLYIYDDCSTDNTREIISSYNDPRIFYRKNQSNLGIAKTLNKGLDELLAQYEFIARMDADDWCDPQRFEKQLLFLGQNREIVFCGTQCHFLKDMAAAPGQSQKLPQEHHILEYWLLFSCVFFHPSVIYRSDFMQQNKLRYDETIKTCEDYDLWSRLIRLGKTANLPDFLMKLRVLPTSNHRSLQTRQLHLEENSGVISRYWKGFGFDFSAAEIYAFYFKDEVLGQEEFLLLLQKFIRAFNGLYLQSGFEQQDKIELGYVLARRLRSFRERAGVGRYNAAAWALILREVKFTGKLALIRSIIK